MDTTNKSVIRFDLANSPCVEMSAPVAQVDRATVS